MGLNFELLKPLIKGKKIDHYGIFNLIF